MTEVQSLNTQTLNGRMIYPCHPCSTHAPPPSPQVMTSFMNSSLTARLRSPAYSFVILFWEMHFTFSNFWMKCEPPKSFNFSFLLVGDVTTPTPGQGNWNYFFYFRDEFILECWLQHFHAKEKSRGQGKVVSKQLLWCLMKPGQTWCPWLPPPACCAQWRSAPPSSHRPRTASPCTGCTPPQVGSICPSSKWPEPNFIWFSPLSPWILSWGRFLAKPFSPMGRSIMSTQRAVTTLLYKK